jgi:5'-nucleotidase
VDAVLAGHTHAAVAHEVNGVPIVQAHYWGQAFGRVDLTVDPASGRIETRRIHPPQDICARVARDDGRCVPASTPGAVPASYEGREVAPDPAVAAAMAPGLARVQALRATPLGAAIDAPLQRGTGFDDSGLGNLFADAIRDVVPGADVAVGYSTGPGGLRGELRAGPLTRGAVYDLFPFDNRVARLEATAGDLQQLIADRIRRPRWRGRSLGVSGLRVLVDCVGADLEVTLARETGQPFAASEPLVVATNDFLANWVGGGAAPAVAGRLTILDLQVRDAVASWLRDERRLRAAQFADPARPRWTRTARAERGCGSA